MIRSLAIYLHWSSHSSSPAPSPWSSSLLLLCLGVLDGFIHREDETCGFRGGGQSVDFHHGWLPHKGIKVVSDVLITDVHTVPLTTWGTNNTGDKQIS